MGFGFTTRDAGLDDSADSDADPATGIGHLTPLAAGAANLTVDAGLIHAPIRDVSGDLEVVVADGNVNATATARNLGSQPETVRVGVWLDRATPPECGATDATFGRLVSLVPGSTESFSVFLPGALPGSFTAHIFVDSECALAEADESNNFKAVSYDVSSPNNPPSIGPRTDRIVHIDNTVAFTVTATDPDPGQTVTLSATGLPTGASFNPATGLLTGHPPQGRRESPTFCLPPQTMAHLTLRTIRP